MKFLFITIASNPIPHLPSRPQPSIICSRIQHFYIVFLFRSWAQNKQVKKQSRCNSQTERNMDVFSKPHFWNNFLCSSMQFWAVYEMLVMESCLFLGQPPAPEHWLTEQSVGTFSQEHTSSSEQTALEQENEVLTIDLQEHWNNFHNEIRSNLISREREKVSGTFP